MKEKGKKRDGRGAMLELEEKWMDILRCVFPWDEEEDEGDTRERVILVYHAEGEIKIGGIKQVTFFLCCHQGIEMIKEENNLTQGEQRNDNLAGSGGKQRTHAGQRCVYVCV